MSIERVRDYFKTYGMDGRILEFDVSSATVELAARWGARAAASPRPCPSWWTADPS